LPFRNFCLEIRALTSSSDALLLHDVGLILMLTLFC